MTRGLSSGPESGSGWRSAERHQRLLCIRAQGVASRRALPCGSAAKLIGVGREGVAQLRIGGLGGERAWHGLLRTPVRALDLDQLGMRALLAGVLVLNGLVVGPGLRSEIFSTHEGQHR